MDVFPIESNDCKSMRKTLEMFFESWVAFDGEGWIGDIKQAALYDRKLMLQLIDEKEKQLKREERKLKRA